jgi:hypothetical protein
LFHSVHQTFDWYFYLGYWAIYFRLSLFRISISLLISSLISCMVFLIYSCVYLNSLKLFWLFIHALFEIRY